MTNYKIFNNDCFNVFPNIKDKTINLFLLDLPYAQTACKWDSLIDLDKMWKEIKRTMKSNAVIVFFCTTKFGNTLINSNPKWFRYDLVWEKSRKVGFLSANKMPLRKHEMIYVFKKEGGTYNPQKTEGKPYKANDRKCEIYSGNEIIKEYKKEDGKYPTTILKFNNPSKSLHRTQKPTDLLEWLIKSYSNENDIVCDFTMGSGSTGIACLNTKRQFLGIEKDKDIFKVAEVRLKTHLDVVNEIKK